MPAKKPMDPELRRLIDERAALAAQDPAPKSDQERANLVRTQQRVALQRRERIAGLPNDVVAHDVQLAAELAVRVYVPAGLSAPAPVLIHLHGGGWVAGDLATHDPFCRLLTAEARLCVVAVDYRRTPEHRFPAALDDTRAAYDWVVQHASEWSGDASRIVLSGDSAGANLAAVTANRFAASGEHARLRAQVLLYPVTDHPSGAHASYALKNTGFQLDFLEWLWRQYAPDHAADDPALSPLRAAKLPALPPTFVATAEYDILRDEGIAYAEKLRAAGVAVTHHHAEDMQHNFCVAPFTVGRFPQCQEALSALGTWLKQTLELS